MSGASPSRRHVLGVLATGAAALLLRPALAAGPRIVTYYGDRQVRLPAQIRRIATTWEAQNSIIAMLGFGDRIVATTRNARSMPMFRKMVPGIAKAIVAGSGMGEVNIEALMQVHPDVLFVAGNRFSPERLLELQGAGIAVIGLQDSSIAAIAERVRITAEVLGGAAPHKARDYSDYVSQNIARVRSALAGVPRNRRVKVFAMMGGPLETMGSPSLTQDWLDLGGAVNIAEHWPPENIHMVRVSLEQVLAAEPDAIIAMRPQQVAMIRQEPAWQTLRAVRQNRLYPNPHGLFGWSRESCEEALQILWVARTLYPEALADVDMRAETRAFYRRFYNYRLSEAELEGFLHPVS